MTDSDRPTQFRRFARARKPGDGDWALYDTGLPDRENTVECLDLERASAFCVDNDFVELDRIYYVPRDPCWSDPDELRRADEQ